MEQNAGVCDSKSHLDYGMTWKRVTLSADLFRAHG